jgi:hypothetical protein
MDNTVSKDIKLVIAREITAAYVRNESGKPSPEEAAAMFRAIFNVVEELAPDAEKKPIGLGA